jgi:hypothetical protein
MLEQAGFIRHYENQTGDMMSETMNSGPQEVQFPDVPDSPEAHEAYYAAALEKIRSGQPTWVQRSFDTENGRILDLFADKKPIGYLEQEYSDMRCEVYIHEPDAQPGEQASLKRFDLSFYEAVELLLDQVPKKPRALKGRFFGLRGH